MKRNRQGKFVSDSTPICPNCREMMDEVWENNGFTEPEGPSKLEITGYKCSYCGHKED